MYGTVAALCAELEDGSWSSTVEIAESYPNADVDGFSVRISVGSYNFVDLLFNFDEEMVLVKSTDSALKAPRCSAKGRRTQ